jgi:hypothetical protein
MTNVWTKIRIGLKIAVAVFVVSYLLFFIIENGSSVSVTFWYKTEVSMTVPGLTFLSILVGVVATIVVRMLWKTVRQLHAMRRRARLDRLERQMADQQASASKLQQK